MDHPAGSPTSPAPTTTDPFPRGTATPFTPTRPPRLDAVVRDAAAVGAGLLLGACVLLVDAMGGVVGMPGKAVRYVFLTTVCLAWAAAWASGCWVARGHAADRVYGIAGALACGLILAAAFVPSGVAMGVVACAAGVPAGVAARARRRTARGSGAATASGVAALWFGVAVAGVVCGRLAFHPDNALALCGALAMALHLPLVLHRPARTAGPTAGARSGVGAAERAGAEHAPAERARAERPDGSAAIVLAGASFAVVGAVVVFLDLLLFRWTVLGAGPAYRLAAGAGAAALVVGVAEAALRKRRSAATGPALGRSVPCLLLASATGVVLVCTAPGGWTIVAGLGVAAACAGLAAAGTPLPRPDGGSRAPVLVSAVFAGALAAVAWRWGWGRVLSRDDASVLLAVPVGILAVAAVRPPRTRRFRGPRPAVAASAAGLAALAAVGAFGFPAHQAHAAETAAVEVTASTGLVPGQKVTVSGTGFQPGLRAVAVGQCSEGYTGPQHCDLGAGATFVNIDADGRLPEVVLTMVTSVHGVDCLTRQCVIGVGPLPGTNPQPLVDANTVDVRIGFVGGTVVGDEQPRAQSTNPAGAGTGGSAEGPSTGVWIGTMVFLGLCLGAAVWDRRVPPTRAAAMDADG
ncbi:neocarzinostatin apoprotein domain-containing protein [Yinghuangia sp. YIM S09857]|uniref:neocarzinostatin apoprotein domain-containing protein n=1 Tax=Yinghuangia sp. YIM S09857 TaxID=3436929 RepID=UPI003F53A936